ncbi:MAG: TolC family protein [Niabella sp.]|nr:MAG: TolC family protein [Niabella sp.]
MSYLRLRHTVMLLISLPLCSRAQRLLTAEEAVASALKNNYEILLLKNDSAVFALQKKYAQSAFYPRINAGSTLLLNNNNVKQELQDGSIRKGDGIRSNNVAANINLNWTLFDGLKMFATRDRLNEQVKLGELNIRNQLVNTVAAVLLNYYNIVRQKQQLKAIEEQMSINEERVRQAEKKLSVGLGAKPELLQARLDLNAQKASRLTQMNLIEQLKEQLNGIMTVEAGTRYEVADSIPIDPSIIVTDIISGAEKTNPLLLTAKQQISLSKLVIKERKADRFPTLQFNSAYNFNKLTNQTVVNNFTPLFNQNLGFNYGLSLNIPIFNAHTVKRQIKEAELDLNYRLTLYEYQRFQINNAISIAYKNYEMQLQNLALEEENIGLARENVQIAMERNRLGISTILELRESQKSLEDAYNRLIAARYQAKQAETELLRLKGDLVK